MTTAPAPIAVLNLPPHRFGGIIHDRVELHDLFTGERNGSVTIVGGARPDETIDLQLHARAVGATASLSAQEAIRLGQILIAAGNDALGSRRTCEHADCPNLPEGAGAFCTDHQGDTDE